MSNDFLYEQESDDRGAGFEAILSVSQFIEYINLVVGHRKVVVEGEISSVKISQGKWVFFDLKDDTSVVSCFCLLYTLHMQVEDGMKVQISGTPRVYNKSGRFSIFVDRVELKGEGALKRAFELTKKKLEAEGLFAYERKRTLVRFPEKIGIITSRDAAGYTDFLRIINARWCGMPVYLYHVHVQGESAVDDIGEAFAWFNENGARLGVNTIALIRGGGSMEDLQAFNTEAVARAVFGSRIPVVCGVGHERDETLADYAADVRAATPTHAASMIVPDRHEVLEAVNDYASSLSRSLEYTLEWHAHGIANHLSALQSSLHGHTLKFQELMHGISRARERITHALQVKSESCTVAQSRVIEYMERMLEPRKNNLAFYDRTLAQINPLTVLKRGYTIVRKKKEVVDKSKGLHKGDMITIQFSDGIIDAKTL